jgi:hypothetical protein
LWEKKNFKEFFKKEGEISTMDIRRCLKPSSQIGNHGVLWIPNTRNVFPLLGGNNQGGYNVVPKVQIKKFNRIPSTIELVGKHYYKMWVQFTNPRSLG